MGYIKGISPLIASVLLVAFTMAIAGIMAAWATSFANTRLEESRGCAMALTISDLTFTNMTVVARITNQNSYMNLTGIKGNLWYDDPTKDKLNLVLRDYGAADPLAPTITSTIIINTNDTARPKKIEIKAVNCPSVPATQNF